MNTFGLVRNGRVLDDLPMFFNNFLLTFFQPPMQFIRGSRVAVNKRATWAQAEMFVSYKLSLGYSPDVLEDIVGEEAEISLQTGDYEPLFLQYCLRILKNMRRAGQFTNLSQNLRVRNSRGTDGRRFADTTVVSQYGTDNEIRKEIDQCDCLDPETERSLNIMRRKLHKEADRIWHEKAAAGLDGTGYSSNPSDFRSSSRARGPRRIGFPEQRTMMESSVSGSFGDWETQTTPSLDSDRGRRRYGQLPIRSDSLFPSDSASQMKPTYNLNVGADFTILGPNSPRSTTSGASEWEFADGVSDIRIHRDAQNGRKEDLSSRFRKLHFVDERPLASRGRRDEERSGGRGRGDRDFSVDSDSTVVGIVGRTPDKFRRAGTDEGEGKLYGRGRRPSISIRTEAEVSVVPRQSRTARGNEREDHGPTIYCVARSRAEVRESPRRDRPVSSPRHRPDTRPPPLAYYKHENLERGQPRIQRDPRTCSRSRPAATVRTATDSESTDSFLTDRENRRKQSQKGPLKLR